MQTPRFPLRLATQHDRPAISKLIHIASVALGKHDYSDAQIDAALGTAWGLDTQLIEDQTYFVAQSNGNIIACGGWSFRETLFGADHGLNRSAGIIDVDTGHARIRAFFVHPDFARQGIGSDILQHCEQKARERGYRRFSLMATLPGQRLYENHGYIAEQPVEYPLKENLNIRFVPMHKESD